MSEDEELRSALDMHQLISQHAPLSESPPQTADQVIEEIDQMLQELRSALDMHQLISQHAPLSESPPQTADQVIEEIDQMLQSCDFSGSVMTDHTMESVDSMYSSMRSPLPNGQYEMDVKFRQAVAIMTNRERLEGEVISAFVMLLTCIRSELVKFFLAVPFSARLAPSYLPVS
ncbi:unnamed protein product [Gongylonema pulchrum]|uniref:GAT domain-containing protein n=1 Tax=Gongylonema pulchrum TaxID=637853 RepID=A0A183DYR4_9BILA|nr:unnamed protein product [Gongylonema pulchrum]